MFYSDSILRVHNEYVASIFFYKFVRIKLIDFLEDICYDSGQAYCILGQFIMIDRSSICIDSTNSHRKLFLLLRIWESIDESL